MTGTFRHTNQYPEVGNIEAYFWNYPIPAEQFISYAFASIPAYVYDQLNWSKLPTSNEAGILQILAEIDDTIAIFTRRFWQSLTYGSVTWGLLPFYNDLVSTVRTVSRLAENLADFSYEDERTIQVPEQPLPSPPYTLASYGWRVTGGTARIRKTGRGDISYLPSASHLLDRIGLHPDLATAWDLVPLSFIADYFVPLGSYLESFREGGWVKTMLFNGWITTKLELEAEWWNRQTGYVPANFPCTVRAFYRHHASSVLTYQADPINWELPSLLELFNTLYVLLQASGRRLPF